MKNERDWMARAFEEHRAHLRAVAYRMLGSLSDADDAVQDAWLRLSRTDPGEVENMRAWLTTVVARLCLNMLRTRTARREESIDTEVRPETAAAFEEAIDVEQEALLADSVGLALLVVLERLPPAERLAFVLHDMFDVSFDEIARVVGRSPTATRQLASRARRRVRGAPVATRADLKRQRQVVDAFLAAQRAGDFDALIQLLDPDVVLRADRVPGTGAIVRRGALAVARGAHQFSRLARFCQVAMVDGAAGIVLAPRGRLLRVLRFTLAHDRIAALDVVAHRERLDQLELAVEDTSGTQGALSST